MFYHVEYIRGYKYIFILRLLYKGYFIKVSVDWNKLSSSVSDDRSSQ